jgi:hypothetical protein
MLHIVDCVLERLSHLGWVLHLLSIIEALSGSLIELIDFNALSLLWNRLRSILELSSACSARIITFSQWQLPFLI